MKLLSRLLITTVLAFGAAVAQSANLPTIHQVFEAAKSGHLNQAEQMMKQVLAVHPDSAKAHFVYAEVLVAEHQYAGAKAELNKAERLKPGLPFEKPRAVQSLQFRIEQGLKGGAVIRTATTGHASSGISWGVILLIGAIVILLVVVIRALRTPRVAPMPYTGGVSPNTPIGSMGGTPVSPVGGGGFMSAVTTGLGVGAGIAAGEALVNHFTHGQGNNVVDNNSMSGQFPQTFDDQLSGNDMGGDNFGLIDDNSWNDDTSVAGDFSDFGSSGDDWN